VDSFLFTAAMHTIQESAAVPLSHLKPPHLLVAAAVHNKQESTAVLHLKPPPPFPSEIAAVKWQ